MSQDEAEEPDYERWADYDSYAYLTVCDGPDDDSDIIAPTAAPPPGDPKMYSLNPARLTDMIGVQPTKTARRGQQVNISARITPRYHTRNVWDLRSTLPRDAAPHEHVKNVLGQLNPSWARFVAATRPYHVIMHIVSKGTNPALVLERPDVERLAEIRAGLDVDMYPDGGGEEEA